MSSENPNGSSMADSAGQQKQQPQQQPQEEEEQEEEATEVENFLFDKLQREIDRNIPCSEKFQQTKKLLDDTFKTPMNDHAKVRFRRKLHDLYNLMTDTDSIFDNVNVCLCHRLSQIMDEIKEIKSGTPSADQQSKLLAPMVTERAPSTPIMGITAQGLYADEMAVENLLLHRSGCEEFNAVGIVGVEGVGKTALAQVIFHNDKVRSRFLPRIWICLSGHPDDRKEASPEIAVARRILLALGYDSDTINKMNPSPGEVSSTDDTVTADKPPKKSPTLKGKVERWFSRSFKGKEQQEQQTGVAEEASKPSFLDAMISAIRSNLIRKRYLIVLDGALKPNEWYEDLGLELTPENKMGEKLAFALPKGTGGAVLVTGRRKSEVEHMVGKDGNRIHQLSPLDKPQLCWDIYMEAAGEENQQKKLEKDEMLKVRDEVVKRCNGLPGAAMLMGEIRKRLLAENIGAQQQVQPQAQAQAAITTN